jgi:molybdate/tungstate transport system ATP-binding protein
MLTVEKLCVNKGLFALRDISFSVGDAEYFALLGPTGSGKTMLLESIAGFEKVSGRVMFNGSDVTHLAPEERGFGFVFQDFALFPHIDVEANIRYSGRFRRDSVISESDLSSLLVFLKIEHLMRRNINTLSSGEKQRVALARSLYARPGLLLLDEPLGALDPATRDAVIPVLAELPERTGVGVIHVTHNFRTAERLAGRTAVILDGSLCSIGPTADVLYRSDDSRVASFLAPHTRGIQSRSAVT